jgi:hypothetical protein
MAIDRKNVHLEAVLFFGNGDGGNGGGDDDGSDAMA